MASVTPASEKTCSGDGRGEGSDTCATTEARGEQASQRQKTRREEILQRIRKRRGEDPDDVKAGPPLAIAWKAFGMDFGNGELTINGEKLYVDEVPNSGHDGTGYVIWDGSVVHAKYLEHSISSELKGAKVLELGSGTGLVGLAASLLGAEVWITDLPYTLPNMKKNVERNAKSIEAKGGAIHAVALDWKKPEDALEYIPLKSIDFVLASDVVWVEWLVSPLVKTLNFIARLNHRKDGKSERRGPRFLVAHQTRSTATDKHLWDELKKNSFEINKLDSKVMHPKFRTPKVNLFELKYIPGNTNELA
eukprot:CAMPEP_0114520848 /NCGR_PEP_ID=MMETSP0109-20121206/19852_1 /TAXON_ID=29199 /ORGANISM="Chlorarachnion reptans, Strain CCCM449" /LENGTH=305 /DNA_ID=CAMNT_0001701875 /DNA_START=210 /DNA_END=1124 /DNA_ORIENTATION=-